MNPVTHLWPRVRAATIHLGLSALLAIFVALIIFSLWFPGDFRAIAGGSRLFGIVVTVDVIMGPLLTFVVFNVAKPRAELVRDIAIIGAMQLAALSYGLYTLYEARPVALVFEVDRFRVLQANSILATELPLAKREYQALPLTGPWMLGTKQVAPGEAKLEAIQLALQGVDIGQRPSYWQPYEDSKKAALQKSRPIEALLKNYKDSKIDIEERLKSYGLSAETARFLPLASFRDRDWVVLLKPNGDVAGFVPYDGFF